MKNLRNGLSIIKVRFGALRLVAPLCVMAVLVLITPRTMAAETGTWVDGDMPVLSIDETLTQFPPRLSSCSTTDFSYFVYGVSPDPGHLVSATGCETQNPLGFFIGAGSDSYDYIRPGTTTAFRVFRPGGRPTGITPVPNQEVFFWREASNYWGNPVAPHFYTNFAAAGDFGKNVYTSPPVLAYELNTNGTVLTDSAGMKIYMKAYAFSANGQWMVMEAYGLGLLRINMQTFQTQLFSQQYVAYNLGFAPSMTLAISDDGNSVIKSGLDAGDTYTYDLSGCQWAPFTLGQDNSSAMTGCRSRYVRQSLQAQLSNFQLLTEMHFSADGKSVSAVARSTGLNGTYLYSKVRYAVAGYQAPQLGYMALGDSFSSGEGEYDYVAGTSAAENQCHLSPRSYPYLAASALGISDFHSVACSGAKSGDYYSKQSNQNRVSGSPLGDWIPGYRPQGDYFELSGKTSVVTISVIGNDIGFSDKLKRCLLVADSCFHYKEDRQNIASEIYSKFSTLRQLYKNIKTDSGDPDNVKVYVLGYPQILGTGSSCGANVPFDQEERQMAQGLISYLDAVIKAATVSAGVQYIDVEHAFDGHRLCESSPFAVNGLSVDREAIHNLSDLANVANSSFHPDPLGHQLMSQSLLGQSYGFTKPMQPAALVHIPYAGDPEYDAFVNGSPSGGAIKHLIYVGSQAVAGAIRGSTVSFNIQTAVTKALSQYEVWFNSTPVHAGTLTSGEDGSLVGTVTVPAGLEPGYHTVHLYGQDAANQDIDMYETMYIAASADDFNGDGVPNGQDPCLIIPASGADQDKDGIDDACDGEITDPPLDAAPPVVRGTAERQPDHGGWYNHDVVIRWSAVDPDPSSGVPTQPPATTADTEGSHTYISDQSCDPTGNCAVGSLTLKLDRTAPDITFTVDPLPNPLGWNKTAVTVTFTCADAVSGIASCSDPVVVSGADGGYVVSGTATDNAGNSAGVNAVVMIDATAPIVMLAPDPAPNTDGWNSSDVTVTPNCTDNLSGVTYCDGPIMITNEGGDQAVTATALDNAGNAATTRKVLNIDKTPPVVQDFSWSANPKATMELSTLTVRADVSLSGIKQAEYFLGDTDPGAGNGAPMQVNGSDLMAAFGTDYPTGVYKVSVRARDHADNWSAAASDYLVVYNPFSIRMTGKRFLMPSLAGGDALPGLATAGQTDAAKFGFSVGYDAQGQPLKNNDFQFTYETGTQCNKPSQAQNCHHLSLNAGAIAWFTTEGPNDSIGIFKGAATLTIDGVSQDAIFILSGIDGERLSAAGSDHLLLYIYHTGDNPSVTTPLYQIDGDILRGTIHIKT